MLHFLAYIWLHTLWQTIITLTFSHYRCNNPQTQRSLVNPLTVLIIKESVTERINSRCLCSMLLVINVMWPAQVQPNKSTYMLSAQEIHWKPVELGKGLRVSNVTTLFALKSTLAPHSMNAGAKASEWKHMRSAATQI